MVDLALFQARVELFARANDAAALGYLKANSVAVPAITNSVGFFSVIPVLDVGNARFEFSDGHEDEFSAFVTGIFDASDEAVGDLAAWPLDDPDRVMTLFGRLAFAGMAQVLAPSTYYLNHPLDVHRNVLAWMQADCRGCAVLVPHLAGTLLLDAPAIAGRSDNHTRQLADLARGAVPRFDPTKFLSASQPRKAA